MYNTTIHVYYRKKKILALLILAVGFLSAHTVYVCKPMFYDDNIQQKNILTPRAKRKPLAPWQAIVFTLLLLLAIYSLLKKLLCKNPALIISYKGVTKNNNTIPWSQITNISKIYGHRRSFWSKSTIYMSVHGRWPILLDPSLMSFKQVSSDSDILKPINHEQVLEFLNTSSRSNFNMRIATLSRRRPKY